VGVIALNPVENVSWTTADELTRMMGLALPTEAQWEYAARAGSTTIWPTGDDRESLRGCANLADLSIARTGVRIPAMDDWPDLDDGWPVHAPAGTFRANPFGLHDLAGNVAEWCRDALLGYSHAPRPGDGLRSLPGQPPMRIHRGGHFGSTAHELRSARRTQSDPGSHSNTLGLRPARALDRR
jgi:formylglycine-generating enzyme required for sulfatase activity